jgi:hypothetical protein
MKNLLLLFFFGLLLAVTSLNYHFILFDDNITVLRKFDQKLEHTMIDARGTKALQIALMPDLLAAGLKDQLNGKSQSFNMKIKF